MFVRAILLMAIPVGAWGASTARAQAPDELAAALRKLDANYYPPDGEAAKELRAALSKRLRQQRDDANDSAGVLWRGAALTGEWKQMRDPAVAALRNSLGKFPPVPKDLKVRVTGTLGGKGVVVENLVFESRPGLVVTANLYRPEKPGMSMPCIVVCHSHHNPKTQGELQDMGVIWARVGCLVLVPDLLGHGERRQHPFIDKSKYDKAFQVGRQDYYFRYNVANQLHLAGENLMGWFAWDLMRCVDVLLAKDGADARRVILLGSVAGGGDPTAVTAALDERIAAVAPFNFGGPQPETKYPLPDDADKTFNYMGGGSWESTRGLRLSARDGFQPWVIVGSLAPRRLIYSHEFSWDQKRDPVWRRLETIYDFYKARDKLASATGKGTLQGKAPESSHCNNIGAIHRREIHLALKRWFDIPIPEEGKTERFAAEKLQCWTREVADSHPPRPARELAAELGRQRGDETRARLAKLKPAERAAHLAREWEKLLGIGASVKLSDRKNRPERKLPGGDIAERYLVGEYPVPVVLLRPVQARGKTPVVVMVAQHGKRAFLDKRADAIAELMRGGVAVCLPDLCGTGEAATSAESRGRTSASTSHSATAQMFGHTLLGYRVRDLLVVLKDLAGRKDLGPVALWGDSFAAVNAPDKNLGVPLELPQPPHAEPMGGLVALLGALFSQDVRAVYVRGGLTSYQALLESPFIHVPHDAIVPGALTAGDLGDVAAALAPRALRLEGLVDGLNRPVGVRRMEGDYAEAQQAHKAGGGRLFLNGEPSPPAEVARWLVERLQGK